VIGGDSLAKLGLYFIQAVSRFEERLSPAPLQLTQFVSSPFQDLEKPCPKIALLSDIHGNLPALLQVVADLPRRGMECILNLGDHLPGPLWPAETAQFLMAQE
jgi:hypothetical protein